MQPKLFEKQRLRIQCRLALQISTKPLVGCGKGTSAATKLVVPITIHTKIILAENRTLSRKKLAASSRAIEVSSIIVLPPS